MTTELEAKTAMESVKKMIANEEVGTLDDAVFHLAFELMSDQWGWVKELSEALQDAKNARL